MLLIAAGDLIVDSWVSFRRNFMTYAEFAAWFVLLGLARWAVATFTASYANDAVLRFFLNLVIGLPIYFMVAVLSVALIGTVAAHLARRQVDVRSALTDGFHKAFPYLWVSILAFLGTAFGFLCVIIPSIILSVRWKFAQNFVVLYALRGRAALAASTKIVTGRWWATLGRLLAAAIFFYAAGAFVQSLVYLFVGALLGDPAIFFGQYSAGQILPKTYDIITTVVPQTISAFVFPLYLGAEILLWNDLKKSA